MEKIIYDRHQEEWDKCIHDEERKKVAVTWVQQNDTLDTWRHNRMYQFVQPIIKNFPNFEWLTIGDGRFGKDANKLMKMGAKKVFCTDVSDTLLRIGSEKGLIKEFAAENAEKLSFDEEEFDFVFCKESFHHFPRPHIGLHEMMRVCKVGVVLIEPNDEHIDRPPLNFLLPIVKWLFGRRGNVQGHTFEPVGNYLFTVSKRELEKIQLGMHRQFIAFNRLNCYYEKGFEFINLNTSNRSEKIKIKKTKFLISMRNLLCRLGFVTPGFLVSILFKTSPDVKLLKLLQNNGWVVRELPKNPYL